MAQAEDGDMTSFMRRYWAEMAVAAFLAVMIPIGWSLTANRQVAYAPCLVKVLGVLKADPAAARVVSVDGTPVTPVEGATDPPGSLALFFSRRRVRRLNA